MKRQDTKAKMTRSIHFFCEVEHSITVDRAGSGGGGLRDPLNRDCSAVGHRDNFTI